MSWKGSNVPQNDLSRSVDCLLYSLSFTGVSLGCVSVFYFLLYHVLLHGYLVPNRLRKTFLSLIKIRNTRILSVIYKIHISFSKTETHGTPETVLMS